MENSAGFNIYKEFCELFQNHKKGLYDKQNDNEIPEELDVSSSGVPFKPSSSAIKKDPKEGISEVLRGDIEKLKKNIRTSLIQGSIDSEQLDYVIISRKFYSEKGDSGDSFEFISLINSKYLDNSPESKIISKLLRHTELALVQKASLRQSLLDKIEELEKNLEEEKKKSKIEAENLKEEIEKEKENLKNLTSDLRETTNDWTNSKKEIEEQIKKVMPEIIGIMGVFATIIFAVFSGFNEITTLGQSLSNTPLFKILIYVGITFIVLLGIVFLSYFAISKFFNKSLKSCGCTSDQICNHNLFEKHPTILIFLWIGFSFISIGFILRLLASRYQNVTFNNYELGLLILALLVIPIFGLFHICQKGIWSSKKAKGYKGKAADLNNCNHHNSDEI
ncbi:hypothetical protein PIG81_06960 [Streptococcus thermophilus]|uniref:hypothetical protein n=1 Tax=Streptococcus thermophilus TaxID=1308 RepID=UPI0022FEA0A3|nr:hypothetical protein [Streptococcus thermophilus]MDA5520428.1 hypothetical protein [Streptococcus thermophilus]MDW2957691.1 hypothetical protein [Streptococcus thermophilus]